MPKPPPRRPNHASPARKTSRVVESSDRQDAASSGTGISGQRSNSGERHDTVERNVADRDANATGSRRSSRGKKQGDLPIERVAIGLYGLIVLFGWCAMASAYHSDTVGRPEVMETSSDAVSGFLMLLSMVWTFARSSVVYLIELPTVVMHTMTEQITILVVMILAIACVFAFVRLTDRVEAEIKQGYAKSSHRRGQGERIARPARRRR